MLVRGLIQSIEFAPGQFNMESEHDVRVLISRMSDWCDSLSRTLRYEIDQLWEERNFLDHLATPGTTSKDVRATPGPTSSTGRWSGQVVEKVSSGQVVQKSLKHPGIRRRIVRAIEQAPFDQLTRAVIESRTNIPGRTIRRHLAAMEKDGVLSRQGAPRAHNTTYSVNPERWDSAVLFSRTAEHEVDKGVSGVGGPFDQLAERADDLRRGEGLRAGRRRARAAQQDPEGHR